MRLPESSAVGLDSFCFRRSIVQVYEDFSPTRRHYSAGNDFEHLFAAFFISENNMVHCALAAGVDALLLPPAGCGGPPNPRGAPQNCRTIPLAFASIDYHSDFF